jgi:hypothetical protein
MKVTAEVPVLETEIGRDENLVPFGRAEDRAIVSDSESEILLPRPGGCKGVANLLDKGQFSRLVVAGAGHWTKHTGAG